MTAESHYPHLTTDIPGIGGGIKVRDGDFEVEELPLYAPSGAGTHTYLWVEKTGLTTERAVERLANALGVRRRDVGYAGLKDARAVTRQMLSVEHVDPERIGKLCVTGIRVLDVYRHTNKIKLGHLRGNRFAIKIRDADTSAIDRAKGVLEVLTRRGMPNYFGPQRFGLRGDNGRIGLAALSGDYDEALAVMLGRPDEADPDDIKTARRLFDTGDFRAAGRAWPYAYADRRQACQALARAGGRAKRAWRSLRWPTRRMFLSALQSELFNQVVARRLDHLDRVLDGDLAMKHANGAVFRVTDALAEGPRAEAFEISPTGPLFGRRMTEPEGVPAEIEGSALSQAGLSRSAFNDPAKERIDGARRPLRVRPEGSEVTVGSDDLGRFVQLRFSLPAGSYATVLVEEVCKVGHPLDRHRGSPL